MPIPAFARPATRAGARILAFGAHQPATVVSNDDLATRLDTSDDWIRSRVGIAERRIAGPEEGIVDMAVEAGGKALARSGLSPAEIDLVIVATCSAESPMPAHAPTVAHRLGIEAPGAFDLNAACAGFCYALGTADGLVRSGTTGSALVIGAEKMSQWVDPDDRSTAVIFADGAGAAVVTGADEPGIGPTVWGSLGSHADKLMIGSRASYLAQDGQAVFRWATSAIAPVALDACRRAGVDPAELAAVVPHQANLRIIRAIARAIGAANAVVAEDIVTAGNTSAASVPLAVSRLLDRHEVAPGAPALLVGFGAGLAYAAQVVRLP
ncbi:beta-ketoacyl-ACP synthase III [Nocardioides sp. DS6]|uniref:Beta-ketoacyl-[acyl-carrier-protein] synthase III n=1 Tax=Nocardioides eburneus TaxID=3231482 RepID=A0ABV3SZB6_9ACTN